MYRPWVVIFLGFTLTILSEAKYEKKLSSAIVVGTVYCDTCFQQSSSNAGHFISGALVTVECAGTNSRPSFIKEVKTNEVGEFKVNLPFSVSQHVNKIKRCSVKQISSSEPDCAMPSIASSFSLHLKSRNEGKYIFSAGTFTFRPLQVPELCHQKPPLQNSPWIFLPPLPSSSPSSPPYPPLFPSPSSPPFNFPPLFPLPPSSEAPIISSPPFPPLFPSPSFPPFSFPPIFPLPPSSESPTISSQPPFPPLFPSPSFPPFFPFPPSSEAPTISSHPPSSSPPPPSFPFPPFVFPPLPSYPGAPSPSPSPSSK